MENLKYISETHLGTFEFNPNWDAVAILTSYNGIKKYEDTAFELHPMRAFMFENEEVRNDFIKNFDKVEHRYDEILPIGTVYYIVHDLTSLKRDGVNYADRLVSKHWVY